MNAISPIIAPVMKPLIVTVSESLIIGMEIISRTPAIITIAETSCW